MEGTAHSNTASDKKHLPSDNSKLDHSKNGSHSRDSLQPPKRKNEHAQEGKKKRRQQGRAWGGTRSRERNVDTQSEMAEGAEREERRPKKKVVCFIGYSGEGYHGMQYNPPMKTIEADIYEAFAKAGAILQANAQDPSSFQRAARTDKGVHAAGNIISLKLMPSDDLVEKMNRLLPPQIRLWGIQRVNNSFNSHLHCDSRVYEYILPSHCFLPPKPGSTAAACAIPLESQNRATEAEDTFWDSIIDSDYFSLLRRYTSNKKETPLELLPELSTEELQRFESIKEKETAAIRAFRISPARLERIRAAIKLYRGTHNFHNLTVGVQHNSSQAKRYIISIDLGEPHLIAQTEWLRIKIHGQSFMLHQIRKMIGAVLIAIRYGVGEDSIRTTLTTKENMHIPKAPAQGLLLERPNFSGMTQKLEKTGNEALHWEPYEEKIEKFKDDFIYKSIFRETTSENVFHEFINFMDSFRYHVGKGLSMHVQGKEEEHVESFQEEEEDTDDVKGDSEQAIS